MIEEFHEYISGTNDFMNKFEIDLGQVFGIGAIVCNVFYVPAT